MDESIQDAVNFGSGMTLCWGVSCFVIILLTITHHHLSKQTKTFVLIFYHCHPAGLWLVVKQPKSNIYFIYPCNASPAIHTVRGINQSWQIQFWVNWHQFIHLFMMWAHSQFLILALVCRLWEETGIPWENPHRQEENAQNRVCDHGGEDVRGTDVSHERAHLFWK